MFITRTRTHARATHIVHAFFKRALDHLFIFQNFFILKTIQRYGESTNCAEIYSATLAEFLHHHMMFENGQREHGYFSL